MTIQNTQQTSISNNLSVYMASLSPISLPKNVVLVSALLFSSFTLQAADKQGAFVGGSLGNMQTHSVENTFEGERYNHSSPAIAVYAGYHFTDWFGLEGQVLGANTSVTGLSSVAGVVSVSPKFSYYVNDNVALYTKLGVSGLLMAWDGKPHKESANDYSYGIGTHVGIGVNIAMNNSVNMRLDYTHMMPNFEHGSGVNLGNAEIGLFMVGVHYQF
ncbi:outer membrane beta-barrel protein [Vibrio cionasavignyae]|uniref:outer membrane beta-barrel protein n=1 Tax=Vibrio cionasavignyae TaxID=2910252 RepID=UPI003D0A5A7D